MTHVCGHDPPATHFLGRLTLPLKTQRQLKLKSLLLLLIVLLTGCIDRVGHRMNQGPSP